MDDMDIDDYSRDRSRSPVRDRSHSPSQAENKKERGSRNAYSGRDYETSRSSKYQRGGRRGEFGRRGDYGRRGRGNRDFYSRKSYSSPMSSEDHRLKTERNYDNSIFIGNIPFNCISQDVETIFRDDFNVIRADIVTSRGKSRGMATVEFASKEDALKAIEKYDHFEFQGREIFVRQDYPPPSDKKREIGEPTGRQGRTGYDDKYENRQNNRERQQQNPPKPGTEIFVGNLPFSINWQSLKDLMREAGEVVRADVRTDRWGKSRGFGTVVFSTKEDAVKAVEMFQGYEIEGRKLDTREGRTTGGRDVPDATNSGDNGLSGQNTDFTEDVVGEGEKSDIIYVSNLPFVTNEDDLFELFETIGKVSRAGIQYNDRGKPSGNAVVQFELAELADLAIENLNNYNYGGRDLRISYAKKLDKESQGEVLQD